ncbi:MAG: translation initiation factor IF-1 [Deltaproteobacteria bacterium]
MWTSCMGSPKRRAPSTGIMEIHCDNDHTVTGRLSGRMKKYRIKVMVGDNVQVRVSPYDPSHGLITYRIK